MNTFTAQQHTSMIFTPLRVFHDLALRKRSIIILGLVLLAMVFGYIFLLGSTTTHITVRKQAQHDIREAYSRIADLESEYFTLQQNLTRDYASSLGYHETHDVVYVSRTTTPEVFAFRVE